jgi:hypothetical protein
LLSRAPMPTFRISTGAACRSSMTTAAKPTTSHFCGCRPRSRMR